MSVRFLWQAAVMRLARWQGCQSAHLLFFGDKEFYWELRSGYRERERDTHALIVTSGNIG